MKIKNSICMLFSLSLLFFAVALSGCLSSEGRLEVKVVDSTGIPLASADVEVYHNGILVGLTETNDTGTALFTLQPGSYEIVAVQGNIKSPQIFSLL